MTPAIGTLYRQSQDDDIADEELLEIEVSSFERENDLGLPPLSLPSGGNGMILKSSLLGNIITTDIMYQGNEFIVTAAFNARSKASALVLGMWPGWQQSALYDVSVPLSGAVIRHAIPARYVLRDMLENLPDRPWVRVSGDDWEEDIYIEKSKLGPVSFDASELYVYAAAPIEIDGNVTLAKRVALRGVFSVDNSAEYLKIDASGIYRSPSAPSFTSVTLPNELKTVTVSTPHISDSVFIRDGVFMAVKPGYEGIAMQPYELPTLREIARTQYPDSPDPLYWLFGMSELPRPSLHQSVHAYVAEKRNWVPYTDFMSTFAMHVHQGVYSVSSHQAEEYARSLIIRNIFTNENSEIKPIVSGLIPCADYLRELELPQLTEDRFSKHPIKDYLLRLA